MEKNDLNNKAMLDISNALVNMSKAMKGLNGTINKMVKIKSPKKTIFLISADK